MGVSCHLSTSRPLRYQETASLTCYQIQCDRRTVGPCHHLICFPSRSNICTETLSQRATIGSQPHSLCWTHHRNVPQGTRLLRWAQVGLSPETGPLSLTHPVHESNSQSSPSPSSAPRSTSSPPQTSSPPYPATPNLSPLAPSSPR